MTPPPVPFLPESAPFTAEQRAYLNGFLAGLFSRMSGLAPLKVKPIRILPCTVVGMRTIVDTRWLSVIIPMLNLFASSFHLRFISRTISTN